MWCTQRAELTTLFVLTNYILYLRKLTNTIMERIKMETDGENVTVNCPNCDNWETLGIDDPRKRLHCMPITKWHPDVKGQNEVSEHLCSDCNERFDVEWDYNNIIPKD